MLARNLLRACLLAAASVPPVLSLAVQQKEFCSKELSALSQHSQESQATVFCSSYLSISTVTALMTETVTDTTIFTTTTTAGPASTVLAPAETSSLTLSTTESVTITSTSPTTVTETSTALNTVSTVYAYSTTRTSTVQVLATRTIRTTVTSTSTTTAVRPIGCVSGRKRDVAESPALPPKQWSGRKPSFLTEACNCLSLPTSTETSFVTVTAQTQSTSILTVAPTTTSTPTVTATLITTLTVEEAATVVSTVYEAQTLTEDVTATLTTAAYTTRTTTSFSFTTTTSSTRTVVAAPTPIDVYTFNIRDSQGSYFEQRYGRNDIFHSSASQNTYSYYIDNNGNVLSTSSDRLCAYLANTGTTFSQNCFGNTAVCSMDSQGVLSCSVGGTPFVFYRDGADYYKVIAADRASSFAGVVSVTAVPC